MRVRPVRSRRSRPGRSVPFDVTLERPGEDAADHAVAVDEERRRQAEQAVLVAHLAVAVDQQRELDAVLLGERLDDAAALLQVRARRSRGPRPGSSSYAATNCGISLRQGLHHVAQKFSTTGCPRKSLSRVSPPATASSRKSGASAPSSAATSAPARTSAAGRSRTPYSSPVIGLRATVVARLQPPDDGDDRRDDGDRVQHAADEPARWRAGVGLLCLAESVMVPLKDTTAGGAHWRD